MRVDSGLAVEVLSAERWSALSKEFDDANYRQTPAYATAAAARVGADSENVAIHDGGRLIGLCNVRTRRVPFLPLGLAYINGAPLVGRGDARINREVVLSHCLTALRDEFVSRRGNVLRIVGVARKDLPVDEVNRTFLNAGFVPANVKGRYRTILLNIGRELSEIRRGLDQKWRNVLNKSERQGLEVIRGTASTLFEEFSSLHRGLVARKNIEVDLGPEFFLGLQGKLSESEQFVVHLALLDGKVVAGHIGAFHGDTAVYLLGASSETGLKTNASYLLQWRVIEYAKQRGCHWYDLGGIDPETNPDVYRFKARIGGADISAPGPFEAGSSVRKSLVRVIESIHRTLTK